MATLEGRVAQAASASSAQPAVPSPDDEPVEAATLYRATQYWCLPTTVNGQALPPLRSVSRRFDVPPSQQPRFTVWRKAFEYAEDMLRLRGIAPPVTGGQLGVGRALPAPRDGLRAAC